MSFFKSLFLESVRLLKRRAGWKGVPLHVQLSGGDYFGGHGSAGFVVMGVVTKDIRIERPVFIELRGKLDEVARGGRAGEAGILGVCEHTVQGVAELVEHGGHAIEID